MRLRSRPPSGKPTAAGIALAAVLAAIANTGVAHSSGAPLDPRLTGPSRLAGGGELRPDLPLGLALQIRSTSGDARDDAPACAARFRTPAEATHGRTPPPALAIETLEPAAAGVSALRGFAAADIECTPAWLASLPTAELVDALVAVSQDCIDALWAFDETVAVVVSEATVAAVTAQIASDAAAITAHAARVTRLLYFLRLAFYHEFYQPLTYSPALHTAAGQAVVAVARDPDFFTETSAMSDLRVQWIVTIDNTNASHLATDVIGALLERYLADPARKLDWSERTIAFQCSFTIARQVGNAYLALGAGSHWMGLITEELIAVLSELALDIDYTPDTQPITENAIFALAHFAYLEPETAAAALEILTTAYEIFPEYSGPWFRVLVDLEYFFDAKLADGTSLDLDALRAEVEAFALPNTFVLDQGRLVVRTAIDLETTLALYDAIKEVDSQFFRKTTFLDPVPGDGNESLRLVIYASPSDYWRFQPFLFGLPTNNGGIYIESQGTFYTYQRTAAESIYTLEELLRHEYVHYLASRYVIQGSFGEAGTLYDDSRLTWFDEGFAEFLVGSTRLQGVLPRATLFGLVENDATRFTIDDLMHATYGSGFIFYRYGGTFFHFLSFERPDLLVAILDAVLTGQKPAVDTLWSAMGSDAALQTAYDAYLDSHIAAAGGAGAGGTTFAEDVPTTPTPASLPENNSDAVAAALASELGTLPPRFLVWPGRFRMEDSLIVSDADPTQPSARELLSDRADRILLDLESHGANFASAVAWFGDVKLIPSGARATIVIEGPYLATAADLEAPAPPTGLVAQESIGAVSLTWNANTETDLAGYRVYRAESAEAPFLPITSELTQASAFEDESLEAGGVRYRYAVTSVDASGNESELSDVVEGAAATDVLIFNGYFDASPGYADAYAQTLDALGYGYDRWDPFVQGELPQSTLDAYADGVVIWEVGYSTGDDVQLAPERRAALEAYLDAGGSLVLSGAYVSAHNGDTTLFSDYLGVSHVAFGPDALSLLNTGAGPLAGADLTLRYWGYESQIAISAPAAAAFVYAGGAEGVAAVATVEAAYNTVFLAFPFADLAADSRLDLLERVMSWLAPPPPVAGDANGDGIVSASDALAVLRGSVGAGTCTLCVCDVNGSGTLTTTDALMVLQRAVGRSVSLSSAPC